MELFRNRLLLISIYAAVQKKEQKLYQVCLKVSVLLFYNQLE